MKVKADKKILMDIYKEMKKNVCEEYNCSLCDMCPLGEFWKTTEEKDGYNECQRQELEYNQVFDQNNYSEFVKIKRKLREN